MKTLTLVLALAVAPMWAQKLDFNFDNLAAKAKEKAEIDIQPDQIEKMAGDLHLPIGAVSSVVLRHYEFDQPGQFNDADLAKLRKQAADGGWMRFLNVKEKNESTEIYSLSQGGKPAGFLLIAAEAKELTVAYVMGTISVAQLQTVVASTIQYDMKGLEK